MVSAFGAGCRVAALSRAEVSAYAEQHVNGGVAALCLPGPLRPRDAGAVTLSAFGSGCPIYSALSDAEWRGLCAGLGCNPARGIDAGGLVRFHRSRGDGVLIRAARWAAGASCAELGAALAERRTGSCPRCRAATAQRAVRGCGGVGALDWDPERCTGCRLTSRRGDAGRSQWACSDCGAVAQSEFRCAELYGLCAVWLRTPLPADVAAAVAHFAGHSLLRRRGRRPRRHGSTPAPTTPRPAPLLQLN